MADKGVVIYLFAPDSLLLRFLSSCIAFDSYRGRCNFYTDSVALAKVEGSRLVKFLGSS